MCKHSTALQPTLLLMTAFIFTQGCPAVDLLVRTSGECRLSDFLLWQSSHAVLHFTPVLWPDFTFMHLLQAIVSYQRATPLQTPAQVAKSGLSRKSLSTKCSDGMMPEPSEEVCTSQEIDPMHETQNLEALSQDKASSSQPDSPLPTERSGSVRSEPAEELIGSFREASALPQPPGKLKAAASAKQKDIHVMATDKYLGPRLPPPVGNLSQRAEFPGGREDSQGQLRDEEELRAPPKASGQVVNSLAFLIAPTRRNALPGLDRRKSRSRKPAILADGELDAVGMFQQPVQERTDKMNLSSGTEQKRAEQLRQNGFAGKFLIKALSRC